MAQPPCYHLPVEPQTLRQLSALAKLELSAEEEADFSAKFDRLLAFVEQVQAFDPGEAPAELAAVERLDLRRDTPVPFEWPAETRHEYRVPQVINFEGDS